MADLYQWREKAVEKKLMAPLWLMYPEIPEGSIGWRMGYGEDYRIKFYKWFQTLSVEEQKEYNSKFPKPVCWQLSEHKLLCRNDFWIYKWKEKNKPVYSITSIIEERKRGGKREQISFWRPRQHGDKVDKSCFSQWYMIDFYVGHVKYCCMEQYMMSKKAELFGDAEMLEKIMNTNKADEIQKYGRKVKYFDEDIWNQFKFPIVLTGNYYKFSQIPELRHFLLDTGNSLLVEASPYDKIWGIGLKADDEKASDPDTWRGENLLGFALMEVRDELNRLWRYEKELM